jgi:3-oxoacyl-[acyl-carrier-protein] synthase III
VIPGVSNVSTSSLISFGRYVPEHVLGNEELAKRLGCEPGWIETMSGIAERRIAEPEETIAVMAARAAEDCLKRGGVAAADVGMVIVSSGSSERRFPGPAAEVANSIGVPGVPAIDLPMASTGSLFGMAMAAQFVPSFGRVLVVAAERMSGPALAEPLNSDVAILFGDGAGACLIGETRGVLDGTLEIVDSALHSDGTWAKDLRLEFTGPVQMNGRAVIMQASRKVPGVIGEVLARNEMTAQDVQYFLLHQANQNLIDRVARVLGVGSERFPSNIRRYGNTSSASLLIAASEWIETAELKPGDPVCFAVFGAGFHWGALLARKTLPRKT